MRTLLNLVVTFFVVAFQIAVPAAAEERIALLIANQNYNENVGRLSDPFRDVVLLQPILEKLGFQVTVVRDATYKMLETSLRTHTQRIRKAGPGTISFLYYSGHGAADPETSINYIIPVDANSGEDSDLWLNSFELGDAVKKLRDQSPEATHYVVVNACRDALKLTRQGKKALGSEKGFTPVSTVAGVMIAFATAPGRTSGDAGDKGSAYARALAAEIDNPGVEAVTMFRNVQLRVKQEQGQDPWLSFPSLPAVFLAGRKSREEIELDAWNAIKDTRRAPELVAFLETYPAGQFAPVARGLLDHYRQEAEQMAARKRDEERKAEAAAALKKLEANVEAARKQADDGAARDPTAAAKLQAARDALKRAEEAAEAATKAVAPAGVGPAAPDEKIVIAALPKIDAETTARFDGTWTINQRSETCAVTSGQFKLTIKGNSGTVAMKTGEFSVRVAEDGSVSWTSKAATDGAPIPWTGRLSGNNGAGSYVRLDRKCSGVFTATRG